MLTLIRNVKVFSPEDEGINDILISEGKVLKIADRINLKGIDIDIKLIDAEGKMAVPGFIDQHVHIIGGGGEAGPYSRTPEIMLSQVIKSGVTTVVGLLGTDATTRHLESLLAKAIGLETEGITTYILTGSFEFPLTTITGSARRDIILIDKVIGIGEFAISDYRSSQPTKQELIRLITEASTAGLISGKAGTVFFHLGNGDKGISILKEILQETEISINQLVPTHVNRKWKLFEECYEFIDKGGTVDLTAGIDEENGFLGAIKPSKAIKIILGKKLPIENVTISSDGNGSMAVYNDKGRFEKLLVTTLDGLLKEFKDLVNTEELSIDQALKPFTINPARVLGIDLFKGRISNGYDADIVILDEKLNLDSVIAKGIVMMENKKMKKIGTFEKWM